MRNARVITIDDDDPEQLQVVEEQSAYARFKDQLAKRVRTLYCICVREATNNPDYGLEPIPRWDGDPDGRSGTRHQNVWPRVAEAIITCGADPYQFIRAQFHQSKRAKPPYPNQMYSDAAIANWEQFRSRAKEFLQQQIASDFNQIQVHVLPLVVNLKWDDQKALNYVLRSQTCGASSLIRYCQAVAAQLPVAETFRERALVQYLFQTADYDDLLGDKIPAELREEVISLRCSLIGQ